MLTFKQLLEKKGKAIVVVYAGRFQPFHPGHKETYDKVVKEFGKANVYIGTSDKVELPKSPFNFKEKKKIITTMFKDIPKNNIVKVKNPFNPVEILNKYPDNTVYIAVVGRKDADRLNGGKYFSEYRKGSDIGYKEEGYYFVSTNVTVNLSGTEVRNAFKTQDTETVFKSIYGKDNPNISKLIGKKLK